MILGGGPERENIERDNECNWEVDADPDADGHTIRSSFGIYFQDSPGAGFSPIQVEVEYRFYNTVPQQVAPTGYIYETINVFGDEAFVPFQLVWDGDNYQSNPVPTGTYAITPTITILSTSNGNCEGDKVTGDTWPFQITS